MASFTLTPVEKGILRCQHTEAFSTEDIQSLTRFLRANVFTPIAAGQLYNARFAAKPRIGNG